MSSVPNGVIFIWTGTNASIPTGWERVTSLDGKYPKATADGVNPNVTGGNTTHTHTSTAHTHTLNAHVHSITVGGSTGGREGTSDSSDACSRQGHPHTGSITGTSGGGLSSVSATYSAYSNDPPYYTVIFIKPIAQARGIPNGVVYFYTKDDSKPNHYVCDGNNSTPNLVNKYLKGANAGTNAGSTGGSLTNTHSLTHTHTVASHTHSYSLAKTTWGGRDSDEDSNDNVHNDHTHSGNLNSITDTISSTAPILNPTETVEPAYKKLLAVQNRTGGNDARIGMIGLWLGTLSSIPANYDLCDGTGDTIDMRGKHLKCTATYSEVDSTGGSNTHTHASQTHTHTATGSHSHTGTATHVGGRDRGGTVSYVWIDSVREGAVTHSLTTSTQTCVYANASTTADSSNNEPEYRTVAFIRLNSLPHSGAMFI